MKKLVTEARSLLSPNPPVAPCDDPLAGGRAVSKSLLRLGKERFRVWDTCKMVILGTQLGQYPVADIP